MFHIDGAMLGAKPDLFFPLLRLGLVPMSGLQFVAIEIHRMIRSRAVEFRRVADADLGVGAVRSSSWSHEPFAVATGPPFG